LQLLVCGTPLRRILPDYRRSYRMETWQMDGVRSTAWMYGACLAVRRTCMEQVGEYDEGFPYMYVDADYCWRAHQHGWDVIYVPRSVMTHSCHRELTSVLHPRIGRHLRSILRYLWKDYYGANLRRRRELD